MKLHILLKFIFTALIFFGFQVMVWSQFPGCPDVTITNTQNLANANNVIDLDCDISCVDLVADPFHAGETTEYIVESIPHTPPIPYNQAGGTPVSVNIDDRWSPVVDLPFSFCFYGQTYTSCVIGSNGAIKFGNSSANGYHDWNFSVNAPNSALANRGDVFGIYHDIDPSIGWSSPSIKWYLVGDAPCRILCVVFKDLAHYNTGYCSGKKSTFMMVLYETTNAIDVYVQRKDLCTNWNDGHAIIGIQNPANSSQGVVAPGRNSNPNWSVSESSPEGWRFTPNGAPIYDVNWYVNDQLINTGTTINVCPSVSTVYEARTIYNKCDGTTVEASDYMTVNPPLDAPQLSADLTDPTCVNPNGGSAVISATGGLPPYQYSSNNTNYTATGNFNNLPEGDHTFYVKDADNCISNILVHLEEPDPVVLTINSTVDLKCFNDNSGEVHVSATGGSGGYMYSVDGGTPQAGPAILGLSAGSHQVTVTDAGGCTASESFTLTQPTDIAFQVDYTTPATCNVADGEIYTTVSGGQTPYAYQIDGQPATASVNGDFTNIPGGTFTVTVSDANGCSKSAQAIVELSSATNTQIVSITPVTCFGSNDGEVVLSTTGGTGPYAYEIDDTTIVNQPTISGLSGGQHVIMSSDIYGCVVYDTIDIPEPDPLMVNIPEVQTICVGDNIIVNANVSGGNGGYQYEWNTGQTVASFTASPTQPTTYSVEVIDAKGCQAQGSMNATILEQPVPVLSPDYTEGYPGWVVEFTNSSSHASTFYWDFGNGQTTTTHNLSTQEGVYNEVGEYDVILTASNGVCQNSAMAHVSIIAVPGPVITLPNVMSPNGDNVNDELTFIDLKHIAQVEYWIFNRWGNQVFHFQSEDFGYDEVQPSDMIYWDGRVAGQEAAEGVYFYKYDVKDLNGIHHQGHGFFHLVR